MYLVNNYIKNRITKKERNLKRIIGNKSILKQVNVRFLKLQLQGEIIWMNKKNT